MEETLLAEIAKEVREEFGIPPFYGSGPLFNYAKEGEQFLQQRVEKIDFKSDLVARSLLKNYINYAYNQRTDEFFVNYGESICAWWESKLEVIIDENKIANI